MPIKKSDKIIAPSRLTEGVAQTLIGNLDGPDDKDIRGVGHLRTRSAQMGIDGAVAAGQILWETGNLTAPRYNDDFNLAGVAITGDDVVQPFRIASIEDGIDLYLQCLYSAVTHKRFAGFPVPASCEQWFARVWMPKVTSPVYPAVKTIDDLNIVYTEDGEVRATWAMDPEYQDGVPTRGNTVMPGLPDQDAFTLPVEPGGPTVPTRPTKPNVDQPTIYNLARDYAVFGISYNQMLAIRDNKFEGRYGYPIAAVFCHIQDGNTRGSLPYWSGVDASSTVMIQKDGSILQVIDEDDGPWTNGDVNQPLQEAAWLIAKGGNINNYSLTIEAEGDASNTLTAAEERAVVWQIETWALKYPAIMAQLVRATFGHYAVNSVSRSFCGKYVARIDQLLTAWLAEGGTVPEPKPEPEPVSLYPDDMTPQLAKRLYELNGPIEVPWSSKAIGFDDTRSEVQTWLIKGKASIPKGGDWTQGKWPALMEIIRRGKTDNIHIYQYADGSVHEKLVRRV